MQGILGAQMAELLGSDVEAFTFTEAQMVEVMEDTPDPNGAFDAMSPEPDEGVAEWNAHSDILDRLRPNGAVHAERVTWAQVGLQGGLPVLRMPSKSA